MLKADIIIRNNGKLVFAKYGRSFETKSQYEVYLSTLKVSLNGEEVLTRLYVNARYMKTKTK